MLSTSVKELPQTKILRTQEPIATMYPKVKVREQEQEKDQFAGEDERNSLLLLKVFDSLSLQDRCSQGTEYGSDSPPSIARIPKSYAPILATPSISLSKGAAANSKEIEDNKLNIRASPVPRPRAVLSSPDNDGMIGSRNQLLRERPSALKMHRLGENTPAQGKVNPRCIKAKSTVNTRGFKESTDNKGHLKGKPSPEVTVPKKNVYLRKGKPSSNENRSSQ